LGYKSWQTYEENNYVDGFTASFRDNKGFTWDIVMYVMFSHYEYFDQANRLAGPESMFWNKN